MEMNRGASDSQEIDSRPESWLPPLPDPVLAPFPAIVPDFLVSKEWVEARASPRLQWLGPEAWEVQSPGLSWPLLSTPNLSHLAAPQFQATAITNHIYASGQPLDFSRVSTKGRLRPALPISAGWMVRGSEQLVDGQGLMNGGSEVG